MLLPLGCLFSRIVAQDRRAECFFAVEVVVERALRNTRALDDILHAGAVITLFGKQRDTCFQQFFKEVFRAACVHGAHYMTGRLKRASQIAQSVGNAISLRNRGTLKPDAIDVLGRSPVVTASRGKRTDASVAGSGFLPVGECGPASSEAIRANCACIIRTAVTARRKRLPLKIS